MRSSPTSVPSPDRPPWATESGLPTVHTARAALHAATRLDRSGSRTVDARESYWHHATGGIFPPADLHVGERLLVDAGLVVDRDGMLYPTTALEEILEGTLDDALAILALKALEVTGPTSPEATEPLAELVPDPDRREELLRALGQRFDDTIRQLLGEIGEELVVAAARKELDGLGHADLAREVRRVSLESDSLGYDVSAPRITGPRRLLEVKATTTSGDSSITIHLTRNEAETGKRFIDWALVVCVVTDVDRRRGEIRGWCPAAALADRLPSDASGGRWEQAAIDLTPEDLIPDLPRPVQ